jgi:hypothetical protein
MFIKMLAFETLEKVNRYTKSFSKPSQGSNTCRQARYVAVVVFPPLNIAALTQCATSGQGKACSFSAALRFRREYLNSKRFNPCFYKQYRCMSMKIMIQILKNNFSQNFWDGYSPAAIINMPFLVGGPRLSNCEGSYRLYVYAAVSKQYHYVNRVYKTAKNGTFALTK